MNTAIRVHPAIKEFIVCTNGSDVIEAKSRSWLWSITKHYLTTKSKVDPYPPILENERVYICLLDASSCKLTSLTDNKDRYLNTRYLRYVDPRGQRLIASELRSRFKNVFHTFMYASLLANEDMLQKQALILFLERYKISLDFINYEMLKKSWDRSDEKEMLNGKKKEMNRCPIIF